MSVKDTTPEQFEQSIQRKVKLFDDSLRKRLSITLHKMTNDKSFDMDNALSDLRLDYTNYEAFKILLAVFEASGKGPLFYAYMYRTIGDQLRQVHLSNNALASNSIRETVLELALSFLGGFAPDPMDRMLIIKNLMTPEQAVLYLDHPDVAIAKIASSTLKKES